MPELDCWKCGNVNEVPERVAFRAVCEHCFAYLHCCKGCMNYKPGLPNDCKIPGTDPIADRENHNFCEFFEMGGQPEQYLKSDEAERKFDDLFQ